VRATFLQSELPGDGRDSSKFASCSQSRRAFPARRLPAAAAATQNAPSTNAAAALRTAGSALARRRGAPARICATSRASDWGRVDIEHEATRSGCGSRRAKNRRRSNTSYCTVPAKEGTTRAQVGLSVAWSITVRLGSLSRWSLVAVPTFARIRNDRPEASKTTERHG